MSPTIGPHYKRSRWRKVSVTLTETARAKHPAASVIIYQLISHRPCQAVFLPIKTKMIPAQI